MSAIHSAVVAPMSIDWTGGINQTWNSIASFIPKLIVFIVILVIGVIVAKAVAKFVGVIANKIGFTNMLSKGELGNMVRSTGIQPLDLLTKLVYYFILLIALQLALSAFGPTNPVSQIVNNILNWLPKAIVAIVIVVVAVAIAGAVKDILRGTLANLSYGDLLTKIVGAVIIALGVIAALNQVGIGTTVTEPVLITVLATVAGILVVGVGGGLIAPMRNRWDGWLDALTQSTKGGSTSVTKQDGPTSPPPSV